MIGVLAVKRSYPALEATYAAWPGMGTICGTLTQAQTGCPVLTFTRYRTTVEMVPESRC